MERMVAKPQQLPTSTTLKGQCPRCKHLARFTHVADHPTRTRQGSNYAGGGNETVTQQVVVIECMGCSGKSVVIEEATGSSHPNMPLQGVHWWPDPSSAGAFDESDETGPVPVGVAAAYNEGVRCLTAQAPNAAAAMFRTAAAQIVEDKGSENARKGRDLRDRIDRMIAEGTLLKSVGEWSHHVRLVGNAGAHSERSDGVSMDEADALREFLRELIAFLYEQAARIAEAKARAAAATAGS